LRLLIENRRAAAKNSARISKQGDRRIDPPSLTIAMLSSSGASALESTATAYHL
jgi:hypothetical protein